MSEQEHISRDKALQWLEGDERMLSRIKGIFMKNVPQQVKELGEYLERGDAASAERAAHTIMGSAAMLGASVMSAEAGKIERSAIQGDLSAAKEVYSVFCREYETVMNLLQSDGDHR